MFVAHFGLAGDSDRAALEARIRACSAEVDAIDAVLMDPSGRIRHRNGIAVIPTDPVSPIDVGPRDTGYGPAETSSVVVESHVN
jgi:hypothetical protein